MSDQRVTIAPPKERLDFDGERVSPWVRGPIWAEHLHRYLSVLPFAGGKRVLDIACGEGYGSALIARNGEPAHVTGADVDPGIIARARRIYGGPALDYDTADITAPLPFADNSFDLICCFETIEHVAAQEAAVAELRRVLAPGGVLVMSTPDNQHPHAQTTQNPFHVKELDEAAFRALLSAHFPCIRATFQRSLSGSVIVDEAGRMAEAQTFWERDGFDAYIGAQAMPLPLYMIFWASDGPLPAPTAGFVHDGVLQALLNRGLEREGITFPEKT